jgi:hypothetical protein
MVPLFQNKILLLIIFWNTPLNKSGKSICLTKRALLIKLITNTPLVLKPLRAQIMPLLQIVDRRFRRDKQSHQNLNV